MDCIQNLLKIYNEIIISDGTDSVLNDKYFSKYDSDDVKRGYLVSVRSRLEFEEKKGLLIELSL